MNRPFVAFAVLGCLSVLLTSCATDPTQGYSLSSMYRDDVDTVAVPIWTRGSEVYRRELETRLTEAIVKRIELDTPYKVVDKSKADTILEGRILQVDQRVGSFNPDTGEPREIVEQMLVSFTWTDLRTGEILVKRRNFKAAAVYYPTGPLDEDFFLGSEDVTNRLAQRIVEELESSW
jgi:hypothetical protein